VWHLAFGVKRFAEIRNLLPGVSEKVLTDQLRQLEKDGVLQRKVTHSVPPRVDYGLTAAGRELIPVMQAMCDWGSKHLGIKPTLPRAIPISA
jgi:DNA-binding HxlR family transcriptional regulator